MTDLPEPQIKAAINEWAVRWGDPDNQAIADIINGTNLYDLVCPRYLKWNDERTVAKPDLARLVVDLNADARLASTTTDFLARLCLSLTAAPVTGLNMAVLFNLGDVGRQVVISALAKALRITEI